MPVATTPVTFDNAATVGIDANSNPTDQCASLTLKSDVTFQRGITDWVELYLNGDISGIGTLTLDGTCLHNNTANRLTISCPLVIANATKDSAMIGSEGWTISGGLTINGYFKVQDGTVKVTCAAEIASGAKIEVRGNLEFDNATVNGTFNYNRNGNGYVTFGAVTVAESTTIPNSSSITLNGAVRVAAGKTLTIPTSTTIGENATFTLAGAGAKIVDGTGSLAGVTCSAAASESGYTAVKINNTWVAAVTWTGGANDGKWATADNWSNKTVPDETTPVAFTNANDITVSLGGAKAKRPCAGMVVEGNVEFTATADEAEIQFYGDVVGTGTLTVVGCGLQNAQAKALAIAPNIVFKNNSDKGYQPWLSSKDSAPGATVSGNVTFVDGFKAWDVTHTITGTSTLLGPTFNVANGSGLILGAVTVPANVTVTRNTATVTFGGKTTIAAQVALEIPNDNKVVIGDDAEFVLSGFGATLVDDGGRVGDAKVTTPITRGAKIVITEDGSKKTYKLSPVGMMIIVR